MCLTTLQCTALKISFWFCFHFMFHVSKIIHSSSCEISKLCNKKKTEGRMKAKERNPQMSKETGKYHEIDVFYVFHEIY